MKADSTTDCTDYKKHVTVVIRPDGTAQPDPVCVAEDGTVKWVCAGNRWRVSFDGGGKPVDNRNTFDGDAGQEDGGDVTASAGQRFKYTVSVRTDQGENVVDPDMVIGPQSGG